MFSVVTFISECFFTYFFGLYLPLNKYPVGLMLDNCLLISGLLIGVSMYLCSYKIPCTVKPLSDEHH